MNAPRSFERAAAVTAAPRYAAPSTARTVHRARDFGVGYGNSSGYASGRRYVTAPTQRLFRCA